VKTRRYVDIKQRLQALVRDGDYIAIIRTGGTPKYKQVEIVVAAERGKPQVITAWICTLLGWRRGNKGHGGMCCPLFHTSQDISEAIRVGLGLEQLDFTTC